MNRQAVATRLLARGLPVVTAFLAVALPVVAAPATAVAPTRPAGSLSASVKPAAVHVEPARASVHEFAGSMGLKPAWLEPGKKLQLKSQYSEIILEADRREVMVNGVRVFLGEAPLPGKKTLQITTIDRDRLLRAILAAQTLEPRAPIRVIALDAGHGGKDRGTHNDALKLEEKHLTLDMAKRLKTVLEAHGFKIVMTRTDDSYIPLTDRPKLAAEAGVDLFVSIHCNAAGPGVRGIETYILTPQFQRSTGSEKLDADDAVALPGNTWDGWNAYLGYTVHRQLVRSLLLPDRGLKHARFAVLRDLHCPGLLVETGYLSHAEEAKLLGSATHRDRVVATLADAIASYNERLVALERERNSVAATVATGD